MKKLELSVLNDYYGRLLNERQAEIMRLYYDCDLSLAEIAKESGITRQGVREALLRSAERLEDYENKLGLARKVHTLTRLLTEIIDDIPEGLPQKPRLKALLDGIKEI